MVFQLNTNLASYFFQFFTILGHFCQTFKVWQDLCWCALFWKIVKNDGPKLGKNWKFHLLNLRSTQWTETEPKNRNRLTDPSLVTLAGGVIIFFCFARMTCFFLWISMFNSNFFTYVRFPIFKLGKKTMCLIVLD